MLRTGFFIPGDGYFGGDSLVSIGRTTSVFGCTMPGRADFARRMSKSKNKSRGGLPTESRVRRKRWAESVELLPKRAKFLLSCVVNV
jgi:hypothetical protein